MRCSTNYLINAAVFIALLIVISLLWLLTPSGNCIAEDYLRKKLIRGYITEKYYDRESHMYPTLVLSGSQDKFVIHEYDKSLFYSYVHPGDSIYKDSGSLEITVFRESSDTTFIINYGCE